MAEGVDVDVEVEDADYRRQGIQARALDLLLTRIRTTVVL